MNTRKPQLSYKENTSTDHLRLISTRLFEFDPEYWEIVFTINHSKRGLGLGFSVIEE